MAHKKKKAQTPTPHAPKYTQQQMQLAREAMWATDGVRAGTMSREAWMRRYALRLMEAAGQAWASA